MNPTSDSPSTSADSSAPKTGWNLYIFSPEESEKMLREEPRVPAWEVLAELKKKYLEEGVDA